MFLIAIIVVLVILLVYCICRKRTQKIVLHGMVVNVIADMDNKDQAIEIILQCNRRMIKLLDHLRKKYKIGITDAECTPECKKWIQDHKQVRPFIEHLIRDFNYENIHENKPVDGKDVAYSLNKGRTIMLCLRDIDTQYKPVDINILMFVTLHEAAHIANYDEWGHGPRFWSIFKYLLEEANAIGIYKPVDYMKTPKRYCGFVVNHNPFFDGHMESIASVDES